MMEQNQTTVSSLPFLPEFCVRDALVLTEAEAEPEPEPEGEDLPAAFFAPGFVFECGRRLWIFPESDMFLRSKEFEFKEIELLAVDSLSKLLSSLSNDDCPEPFMFVSVPMLIMSLLTMLLSRISLLMPQL